VRRLRFGLSGFASPFLRDRLYGDTPPQHWLDAYSAHFGCYEVTGTADEAWDATASERLAELAPPHLRLLPRHPGAANAAWAQACAPLLRRRASGPVYLPWNGPWTARRHDALERLLGTLWDTLPPSGRVAVEFADAGWLRSDVMAMLEMHEAGLVWSTRPGIVPYKVTADFLYLRLTGYQTRRTGDEVAALLERLRNRPVDDREVFVVSSRCTEAYGLHAVERFAQGMGQPWLARPPVPAQVGLQRYAVAATS